MTLTVDMYSQIADLNGRMEEIVHDLRKYGGNPPNLEDIGYVREACCVHCYGLHGFCRAYVVGRCRVCVRASCIDSRAQPALPGGLP